MNVPKKSGIHAEQSKEWNFERVSENIYTLNYK